MGLATIKRCAALRRAQGTLVPKPRPGHPPTIRAEQQEILWAQLTAHPAAYLDEHCTLFAPQTGVVASTSTMSRAIGSWGGLEKRTMGATERDEARRRSWIRLICHVDARRLVFIDESGISITLARRYVVHPVNTAVLAHPHATTTRT